ncbi:hypothetical protein BJY00DRAFT_287140 [Aspergillus carlsbadensis]|nr:hypothetical protein BJY00DRAFT_287140 [Aspergillus carlsbadensis]
MVNHCTIQRVKMLLFRRFFIFSLPSLSLATCYYPGTHEAVDHIQCTPGENSACCGAGSICLTNGLCLSVAQPIALYRGSCTDMNFESDACSRECFDVQPDGPCTIVPYNVTGEGIFYCCNSIINNPNDANPACAFNKGQFVIPDGATIVPGAILLEDYVLASDVNCTNTTNTTNNNNSNNDNTAATNETASNAAGDEPRAEDSSSTSVVAVGAGVGVPLGVLSLVAVAWALFERRKRMSLQNSDKVIRELNPNTAAYAVLGDGFQHQSITPRLPHHRESPLELQESSTGSNRG